MWQTVKTCSSEFSFKSTLHFSIGDNWHLRKLGWCDEAEEPLSDEVRLYLYI